MAADDLPEWARDPSIRRDTSGHRLYRTTAACGHEAWLRKNRAGAFCSKSCANSGANHPSWKGDAVGYVGQHRRVHRIRGKASSCYNRELGLRDCSSEDYEWSHLHLSDGLDPLDFVSLCVPCHNRYDHLGVPKPYVQGSKNGHAKLTEAIVIECRMRRAAGESYAALARAFEVGETTMKNAVKGRTWRHLPAEGVSA